MASSSKTPSWLPELLAMGYDESLPAPINVASQTAMAMVSSQQVHATIQQLDRAAVTLNNAEAEKDESLQLGQAALILETLGIFHWMKIQFVFTTGGEEKALALVQQYHEELPDILECDTEEEERSEILAANIMLALSWEDLEKTCPEIKKKEDKPDSPDVQTLISANGPWAEAERRTYSPRLQKCSYSSVTFFKI
ncbi:hypothetical protein R1sor_002192 [Riccia sorocarpa]|uniref:Uncharacterized protein n=1 Tax=Riccia sorocarpa TaxID=122646 RepID=A0ABD3H172_9MARC